MEEFNEELSREFVIACKTGNLKRVEEIIYSDDKINIHYYKNGYSLDWACCSGCLEIVKFLINQDKYKINVNLQDNTGFTPLITASLCSSDEIVKFLLYQDRYSININIQTRNNNTALELAKRYNCKDVTKTIESYILFMKELQILLLAFNRIDILPNEMVYMIIKIRKRIERYYQIPSEI